MVAGAKSMGGHETTRVLGEKMFCRGFKQNPWGPQIERDQEKKKQQ